MADLGTRDGQPVLAFATQDEWRAWLAANGESADGVWLKLARKDSGVASITHDEALEAAGDPARRLHTLLIGGEDYLPLYGGEAVRVDGVTAGRVRSVAYGHTVHGTIAYVYLPVDTADTAAVEIEVLGRPVEARLAPDVLVDPEHARVRA